MRKINCFRLDKKRHKLANSWDLEKLKKTYTKTKIKKITNPNTGKFWNICIIKAPKFSKIDKMTKKRIKTASDLVHLYSKGRNILNIGAGYGYLEETLFKYRKKRYRLHGIDISSECVKKLRSQFKGEFKKASATNIPFVKDKFDFILILEVLEHLTDDQVFEALKEIKRVLKKDGKLVVSVPVNEKYSDRFNPNRHMRAYTPDLIKAELILEGFKVIKLYDLYAFKNFYWLKDNIIRKVFKNRWKPNVVLILTER